MLFLLISFKYFEGCPAETLPGMVSNSAYDSPLMIGFLRRRK